MSVNFGRILLLILSYVCHNNLHIHLTDPCMYFYGYSLKCKMCVKLDTFSVEKILSMKCDPLEQSKETPKLNFIIFSIVNTPLLLSPAMSPVVNIFIIYPLYQK